MRFTQNILMKIILLIITISIITMFVSTPASYAKLDLKEGDFYYSGTTKGTYTVTQGIFAWLLNHIGDIADWLIGIMTMGIRMVFVGWTALFERLLTTALQSTMGIDINNMETSSTDYSTYADSSYNVTVEGIVYNRVPALNANFFDFEYDKTVTGTGHKMICEECGQSPDACTGDCKCHQADEHGKYVAECQVCKEYSALVAEGDDIKPVIIRIKEAIATWYYIIRILACAAMLVILIFVGIKMAISTIASDKAVYKRMLIDWIVGMILLFSLHYFMIFILQINSVVVNMIAEASSEVNKVQMKQLTSDVDNPNAENEISSEELEVKVYEEIRTRAYDAKLTDGTSGMIMYITLVYFAFRYTFVYLKRMLTVAVLILMSPGVGVAYAVQKALSGRSSVITTWMTEFIMTVIIQIIHALLYSIFISKALLLSLESIPGMIVALILINYTLKADKMFRQIFKVGNSDSLAGSSAEAGSAENIRNNLNTAKGLAMSAKPLASVAKHTPGMALAGLAARSAVSGYSRIMSNNSEERYNNKVTKKENKRSEKFDKAKDSFMEKSGGTQQGKNESDEQYALRSSLAERAVYDSKPKLIPKTDKNTTETGAAYEGAAEEFRRNPQDLTARTAYIQASMAHDSAKRTKNPTIGEIYRARTARMHTIEHSFVSNGNKKTLGRVLYGGSHIDKATGERVKEGDSVISEYGLTKRLGMTDNDKKLLKEELGLASSGLIGMASTFVGLATVVAHPGLGMALLANGKINTNKAFGRNVDIKNYRGKKYKFNQFTPYTMMKMREQALESSKKEEDLLLARQIEQNHKGLAQNLREGTLKVGTLALKGAGGALAICIPGVGLVKGVKLAGNIGGAMYTAGASSLSSIGKMGRATNGARTNLGGSLNRINANHIKQQTAVREEFAKESRAVLANASAVRMMGVVKNAGDNASADVEQEQIREEEKDGKTYNSETGIFTQDHSGETKDEKTARDEYEKVVIELYAAQGLLYDPKTGILKEAPKSKSDIKKKDVEISKKDIIEDGKDSGLSEADVKQINLEIDHALAQIASGKEIDVRNDAFIQQTLERLDKTLAKNGILDKRQKVTDIVSQERLEKVISTRAKLVNTRNTAASAELDKAKLSDDEKATLQAVIEEEIKSVEDGTSKDKQPSVERIMASYQTKTKAKTKAKAKSSGEVDPSKDGSTEADSSKTGDTKVDTSTDGTSKVSIDEVARNAVIQQYVKNRVSDQQNAVLIRNVNSTENRNSRKEAKKSTKASLLDILELSKYTITQDEFAEYEDKSENPTTTIGVEENGVDINLKKARRKSTLSRIDVLEKQLEKAQSSEGDSVDIKREVIVEDKNDQQKKKKEVKTAKINKRDIDSALELLLYQKQLEENNRAAYEEIRVSHVGNKKYNEAVIDLSSSITDRSKVEIEKVDLEYKRKAAIKRKDKVEASSLLTRIGQLDEKIKESTATESMQRDSAMINGPIMDVGATIKKIQTELKD